VIAFSTARLRITTLVEDRGWYGSVPVDDGFRMAATRSTIGHVVWALSLGSRSAAPDADWYGWVAVDETDHVLVGMEVV
jgi:hypothetical protein